MSIHSLDDVRCGEAVVTGVCKGYAGGGDLRVEGYEYHISEIGCAADPTMHPWPIEKAHMIVRARIARAVL